MRRNLRTPSDLTEAQLRQAEKLWRKHRNVMAIVGGFGMSKTWENAQALSRILLSLGVPVRRTWTREEVRILRRLYPTTTAAVIATRLNRHVASVYNRAQKLGLRPNTVRGGFKKGVRHSPATEFKKGQVSWTKGKKGLRIPGTEKTWFKKGNLPHNTLHDGKIVIWTNFNAKTGQVRRYKWIRLRKGVWEAYHVHIWKKHGRRIPKGHIVVFRNGDTMNCSFRNLRCISRTQHAHETQQKDEYIAARLAMQTTKGRQGSLPMDRERYRAILANPDLIEAKRRQMELQRKVAANG